MAPKLKIIYFNARARVEVARLVLAAAKQPYENVLVNFEQFQAMKPSLQFGQVPILEVDGKQFSQSLAIQSYLAAEFGLYGANNLERLQIDQFAQLREELFNKEGPGHFRVSDPVKKAEAAKELAEVHYPKYLGYFSKILKENGTGWVVGNKLSLADLVLFEGLTTLSQNRPDILDQYPDLKAFRAKIGEIDGIKQHVATRPHSVI